MVNARGIQSVSMILFMTWDGNLMIQKIEILPKALYWNSEFNLLTIASKDSFFMLRYNQEVVLF